MADELMSNKDMKKNVPTWVISTCATLMFLSIFINSIGLNLMAINTALTDWIIQKLEDPVVQPIHNPVIHDDILKRLELLESVAHEPNKKIKNEKTIN